MRRPQFLRHARQALLADQAVAWMRGAAPIQPVELPQLLERAEQHLAAEFPRLPIGEISAAVQKAWAEVEAERSRCYVDLEASTAHMIVLVDEVAGVRRNFPVADLVRLLGPRAAG